MTLKSVRTAAGLSQSALAEKSGISKRTLQHYEQGSRKLDLARLETLCDLAIALNCNVVDLIDNEELKKKAKKAMKIK